MNILLHLYCAIAAIFKLPHWGHCEGDENSSNPSMIISREEWGARPALEVAQIGFPVPYVIIHHSSLPEACNTTQGCAKAMRSMQDFHQLTNGWADIGYSFGVGGDGFMYEGRGWDKVGAHSVGWNNISIGIVLIGHWVFELPPQNQLLATKNLIKIGVELGYVNPGYSLITHRHVIATECPGDALYQEITSWDRFDPSIGMKSYTSQNSQIMRTLFSHRNN